MDKKVYKTAVRTILIIKYINIIKGISKSCKDYFLFIVNT